MKYILIYKNIYEMFFSIDKNKNPTKRSTRKVIFLYENTNFEKNLKLEYIDVVLHF